MDISNITFPLYKLRAFISIDKNKLGLIKVTSVKGVYILDDQSIQGTFEERRAILASKYPREKIYSLKERILYFRQLIKYKSKTTFIDFNGNIMQYNKSTKLFDIKSYKVIRKSFVDNWTIIYLENQELPFLVGEMLPYNVTHASIMNTKWGPLLYDLTTEYHEPYKRKI